jgi:hypothetical protein
MPLENDICFERLWTSLCRMLLLRSDSAHPELVGRRVDAPEDRGAITCD